MNSPELTALLPVNATMAHSRKWAMPHAVVLQRLIELTQGRVIRSDQGVPRLSPSGDTVQFHGAVRESELFIDVVVSKVVRGGKDVLRRVEEALRGPVLDNFEGCAAARLTDESGQRVDHVAPGGRYRLTVEMLADRPDDAETELVSIQGGDDVPEVVFEVVADGGPLGVTPRRGSVVALADGSSRVRTFTVAVPNDPEATAYKIYVQVYQKTRLVCVVKVDLPLTAPERGQNRE